MLKRLGSNTWWAFQHRKKYLAPLPLIPCKHPPGPSPPPPPHPPGRPPLLGLFYKNHPPPSRLLGGSPFLSPEQKNKKYPKRPPRIKITVATQIKVKLIPKYFVAFAFVMILIGTYDLPHACSHRYFTLYFTFAFAFVILKVINSEIVVLRFALISV